MISRHQSMLILVLAAVLAVVIVGLCVQLLGPLATVSTGLVGNQRQLIPELDYRAWHALPVFDERVKPLETECMELVRQITGRTRHAGVDPVGLVLAWRLLEGKPGLVDWETEAFILCDHHELRRTILSDPSEGGGKFVSPAQLRESAKFDDLLAEVAEARRVHQGKAHLHLSTVHLKAEEVAKRLALFDALSGRQLARLHRNALVDGRYLDLHDVAELPGTPPDAALARFAQAQSGQPDPLRWATLAGLPMPIWFNIGELVAAEADPNRWRRLLDARLLDDPRSRLTDGQREALERFEGSLRSGTSGEFLDELARALEDRRKTRIGVAAAASDADALSRAVAEAVRTQQEQELLKSSAHKARNDRLTFLAAREWISRKLEEALQETDLVTLQRLRQACQRIGPDSPAGEIHVLGMQYLEALYPDLYRAQATHVEFPRPAVERILQAFAELRSAYTSGQAEQFQQATDLFAATLAEVGDAELRRTAFRTIPAELLLNRTQPFRWSWIIMLAAGAAFLVSLNTGWRTPYWVGWGLFVLSLLGQIFGLVLRIVVAGRAPVGNMYETVVFVAFLAAVFALVLEAIYRRTVIALTGAAVGTLGLVLADQLPLALDPRISPLVPVLRSNFWLTVHVLTIVASYAGASLAWGLGNVSLGLLAFGRPQRDTLRTLALFTYRAMQIAVVLLALGTVLGAWWASEAWGRYWGWDPKEVGALIALICYVIPLHARYAGWIKDFGLAVAAVLCYAAIILSWYVINFVIAAGLHSYGFSGGGGEWVLLAGLINLEWVLIATWLIRRRQPVAAA